MTHDQDRRGGLACTSSPRPPCVADDARTQLFHDALLAEGVDELEHLTALLLRIEIESYMLEATGHFNVQRYLGLEATHGPGGEHVAYTDRAEDKKCQPGTAR